MDIRATELMDIRATGLIDNGATGLIDNGATELMDNGATELIDNGATGLMDNGATGLMDNVATARVAPTVGNIIGAYKSLVTNGCLNIYKLNNKTMGKLWQRNYYEHIIRNEKSYQTIANYIINNPSNWENDKFFKK
jgi:hypothetical protein